jgi:hypothetical protein
MTRLNHESRQILIRTFFGIPIVMKRESVPFGDGGNWKWGKWKFAGCMDVVVLNADLRLYWK